MCLCRILLLPVQPIFSCSAFGAPGVTFYISEYGDVRALLVNASALILYDKVCFSTTNYIKSHYFDSSHYFNRQENLQCRN